MCGRSTCKIALMADWQFLRTGNKSNNHRSMRTCSRARGSRMRRMDAHVACAVLPPLASRLRMQQNNAPECLGIRARAGERRGGCHGQGRARVRRRGDLRHERNGASPFDARAGRPLGCERAAGLRRTGAVCRVAEAPFSWPMATSRSEGAARSRARGRCARPGAQAVTQTRTWSTGVRRWHRHWQWGTARLSRNVRS